MWGKTPLYLSITVLRGNKGASLFFFLGGILAVDLIMLFLLFVSTMVITLFLIYHFLLLYLNSRKVLLRCIATVRRSILTSAIDYLTTIAPLGSFFMRFLCGQLKYVIAVKTVIFSFSKG